MVLLFVGLNSETPAPTTTAAPTTTIPIEDRMDFTSDTVRPAPQPVTVTADYETAIEFLEFAGYPISSVPRTQTETALDGLCDNGPQAAKALALRFIEAGNIGEGELTVYLAEAAFSYVCPEYGAVWDRISVE